MVGLERGTVELEPYDEAWSEHYEAEVRRLRDVAGDRFVAFEHVGSTAIEGMPAKPIIDVVAVVDDLDAMGDLPAVLEANGYEQRPDEDVSGRLFFAKGPRTDRTHYLSVTERDSDFYAEKVAFRDFLRENPDVAAEYAALKRELAAEYPEDRARYTEAKGAFVRDVLARAADE